MGVDRRAVLQNAQSLASRGQFDAAIAEWKKLLTNSPSDGTVHNSIGDLQLKRNASKEAIAAYLEAGKAFRTQGETLKAIAAYKKILKVDPSRTEIYRHLGDLNAERGLVSSAVADYSTLARLYLKERKTKDALEIYRIILGHDPSNINVRKQIVELCVREKIDAEQFLNSPPAKGSTTQSSGSSGSSPTSSSADSQQGSELDKQISEAVRLMGDGNYDGADSVLSQLLNQEPGNPAVCQALARLHLKRGELAVAQNEYEFLAGAALRADDLTLTESLIKEFLEIQASCAPLSEMLGMVYEKRGDKESAALHYGKALQALLEHPDPDMPALPEELYAKIKEIAPGSFLIDQFAPAFGAQPATSEPSKVEVAAPSAPPVAKAKQVSSQPGKVAAPKAQAPQSAQPAAPSAKQATPSQPVPQSAAQPTSAGAAKTQEDMKTRFVLGGAYKDMGLLNEAIEEFRLCVTVPDYFLDSCFGLATCLRERGMGQRAIACLEHAMNDPRCEGDKSSVFRYELGLLYEAEGLFDRALGVFQSIPTFQDAAKHIEWIKGGGHKEGPVPAGAGSSVGAGKGPMNSPAREGKKRRISYL